VKSDVEDSLKSVENIDIYLRSDKNIRHFNYAKTWVRFVVAGDIKSPHGKEMVSGCWDSRVGINIMRTRHNVTLWLRCLSWLYEAYVRFCGPGSVVDIAARYGLVTGWSNPGGGEIFRTCPDRPWGPPSLLYKGYRVFPGGKERPGRDADLSPFLVPWSRKSRARPILLLWAVRPVQSLSACTRVHFTFYLKYTLVLLWRVNNFRVNLCLCALFNPTDLSLTFWRRKCSFKF